MKENNKTVLWFGGNVNYSRNHVLRTVFADLQIRCIDFKPKPLKKIFMRFLLKSGLLRLPKVDAIWVPCFRHRDMNAASLCAKHLNVPLIFDPLISSYDKKIFEHKNHPENSPEAEIYRQKEIEIFKKADCIVADTICHKEFFSKTLEVSEERCSVVYVGADSNFVPNEKPVANDIPEVLFYGSFLGLHGIDTIIDAACNYAGTPVRWTLLGEGPQKQECEKRCKDFPSIRFEPEIEYENLPRRISEADILLGVFGTSPKASRVIPNKVFQAMACGKPLVTNTSKAYPTELRETDGLVFIEPGDGKSLAKAVEKFAKLSADERFEMGKTVRANYEKYFGQSIMERQVIATFGKVGL